MPRPSSGTNFGSSGNSWSKTTRLEKILIVITVLSIILVAILLAFLLVQLFAKSSETCMTPTCIKHASYILESIDQNTNPCDDFYQFVCGNFLKNAHGDEDLALSRKLLIKSQKRLIELYWEPIKDDEHAMVKAAKKLFRSCMNETEIERDNLETIIEAVTMAGGWPVIEGSSWNQGNFDWIRASSILRRLGYLYSIFLDVDVSVDPDNSSRTSLVVSLPANLWSYSSRDFNAVEFMTDIAMRFGAKNRAHAKMEMEELQKFLLQLQLEAHSHPRVSYTKYRVSDFQKSFDSNSMNWLHFINNILGRKAGITDTDYVLFHPPEVLKNWLVLIQRTPKKTQANYLMWKVIEGTLPYLTRDLRTKASESNSESREDFCLKTAHSFKVVQGPMDIIYDRRYLPLEKKEKVEEIADKIKTEYLSELETNDWLQENDKKEAQESSVVIGQPGGYFDDKILDDLQYDMIVLKRDSFLNLYAQAKRNYQTAQYMQIHKSAQEILRGVKGNYISSLFTEDFYFDKNRPQYLNFGGFGQVVAEYYSSFTIRHGTYYPTHSLNVTKNAIQSGIECVESQQNKTGNPADTRLILTIVETQLTDKIAYGAYEKWVKNHGEELKLIGSDYTPKQLFWISTTMGSCEPRSPSTIKRYNLNISAVVSQTMRNSVDFSKDFNCPVGSNMNPSDRCSIF